MRTRLQIIYISVVAGLLVVPVQAHQDGSNLLYVAPDGVDVGNCHEEPCGTLEYTIGQAEKGEEVVVAAGTYVFDPEETALLLSDIITVRGGYDAAAGFITQQPDENPTYVTGPPAEYRDALAQRGLTLIQDLKGEAIDGDASTRVLSSAPPLDVPTTCEGGLAGPFPCNGIDFLSQVRLDEFSTSPSSASDIWGFVDLNDNREYALIGFRNGTAVVDVTDPENPVEVGTIPGADAKWRDIKVYQLPDGAGGWDAYAYVTADFPSAPQGLQIIDLRSLPGNVSLAGTFSGISRAHNVYLGNVDYSTGQALPGLNPYLVVAGADVDGGAFRILDLSDPAAPQETAPAPATAQYVHDATSFVISDERTAACLPGHNPCELYIDFNENTVDIWDVTDKAEPFQISSTSYPQSGYTHSGWWTEDKHHMFIQDELDERNFNLNTTLRTLNLIDLAAPTVTHTWTGSRRCIDHNGFVKGDRLYMSNYRCGLTVLDVADPNDPQEVGFFDTFPVPMENSANFNGAWGTYPFLPSGTLLVSDIEGGLFVLKEAAPTTAREEGFGFVWADNASADSYTPSPNYSYNSAGGPITVSRTDPGSYSVRFAGLGGESPGGHVQITAYGSDPETCKAEGWSSSGTDFVVTVRCFGVSGNAADVRFIVYVTR